jgi:hypothetical protein
MVTIFNMSDHTVKAGPSTPSMSNHGMAAISLDGKIHALLANTFFTLSSNPQENAYMRHYVWDISAGIDLYSSVTSELHI